MYLIFRKPDNHESQPPPAWQAINGETKGRVRKEVRYLSLCEWAMFATVHHVANLPSSSIYISIMHVSGRRLPDEKMFCRHNRGAAAMCGK